MPEPAPSLLTHPSAAGAVRSAAFQYRERWGGLFFGAGWVLLAAALLFWGGLALYQNRLDAKKSDWQAQIEATKTELEKKNLDRIFSLSNQLSRTKELLGNHVLASRIFSFLSQNTHPRVRFTGFKFLADARELQLSGTASSFQNVSEQIAIFEGSRQAVERVAFGGLSLGDKGLVNFQVTITLAPGFFRGERF